MRDFLRTALFFACLLSSGIALAKSACIAPNDARNKIGKDVCVTAHIYRVVDTTAGIHFLDVCSPQTADADCHFLLLSLERDRKSVGNLQSLVGKSIRIRGTVHKIAGHAAIVLSNRRQLQGGKEHFHPNPQLIEKFSAQNGKRAFSAKNGSGGQRGVHFSNRGR